MTRPAKQSPSAEKGTAAAEARPIAPVGASRPGAPVLWPVGVALLAQGLLLALVYWLAASGSPPIEALPVDGIAPPDGEAAIGVRLERVMPILMDPGTRRRSVEFTPLEPEGGAERPQVQGTVASDAEGLAMLSLKAPSKPGVYRYSARATGAGPTVDPATAEIVLEVVPADRPLLFVLAPETIADVDGAARADARAFLAEIVKDRAVVYVSRREHESPARLREWLKAMAFPAGPILVASGSRDRALRYLIAALRLERFKGAHWAVAGDTRAALAFQLAGARVVFLDPPATFSADGRAVIAAHDWEEAKTAIQEHR